MTDSYHMLLRDAAQPRRTTRQLALVFGAFVVGFLLALCLTSMTAGNNSLYSQTSVAAQRPLPASHRLRAAEDSEPQGLCLGLMQGPHCACACVTGFAHLLRTHSLVRACRPGQTIVSMTAH